MADDLPICVPVKALARFFDCGICFEPVMQAGLSGAWWMEFPEGV